MKDLTDLRRGLVLDLNPVATAKLDGQETTNGWSYDASRPEFGMNLRWGITPNLTMNGTINPDFSQVESDAGQFSFDPRQALFFPEKRPFFLDSIEQFSTPNNLIYTRRVVAPLAATKITGKVTGRTNLAYLAAVDDAALSASGQDHPVFNILRIQQDVGAKSRAALVYTDRIDGDRANRVIASDARFVWSDIYSLTMQGAMSRTSVSDAALGTAVTTAPLWQSVFARAGRRFGMRYTVRGVDPDFRAAAGFISRTGIASGNFNHQIITYGKQGSALERWSSDVVVDGTWQYDELMAGRASQDRKLHFNNNFTLKGGWRVGGSVLFETFGYDQALYSNYYLGQETASGLEFIKYPDGPRLPNLDYVFSATTPQRLGVELDALVLWGKDENFYEWSSADIVFLNMGAAWKPTGQLRVDARYQLQSFRRRTDGSMVGIRRIPRLKAEYQNLAPHLRPRRRRVQQRLAGRPARRLAHESADLHPQCRRAIRARREELREVVPCRLAVLVSADAWHGAVCWLWEYAGGSRGRRAHRPFAAHERRILPQAQLSVQAVAGRPGTAATSVIRALRGASS